MKPDGLGDRNTSQAGFTAAQLHATKAAADESNRQKWGKVGIGGDDGHDGNDEKHGDERQSDHRQGQIHDD